MKIVDRENLNVGDMKKEALERRPLPIGRKMFEEWSERIIDAAGVGATYRSQKFALASMLMHLAPTEAFKEDAYFILSLRKGAVNETAHCMLMEIKEEQELEKKQAEATATKLEVVSDGVLEIKKFPPVS